MRHPLHLVAPLLAPPLCPVCRAGCEAGDVVCPKCLGELSRAEPGTGPGWWAAAPYEGPARQAVIGLKFGRLTALTSVMAGLIARRAPAGALEGVLVPVPPSPRRRRARGFDPAALIAAALVETTGMALATPLRRSHGPRQAERPRAKRLADPPEVRCDEGAPSVVVLVDDVRTTGATLGACAAALRGAGTEAVSAVTFAWTRPSVRALGAGGREA